MPGKDGVTAVTELLGKHPQAVVVMCTSLASRDKILACQKAGVSHFLLKPFDPANATTVFRGILARPRAPAQARS
jgi:two-component system chemotaxis response regulator CheY